MKQPNVWLVYVEIGNYLSLIGCLSKIGGFFCSKCCHAIEKGGDLQGK